MTCVLKTHMRVPKHLTCVPKHLTCVPKHLTSKGQNNDVFARLRKRRVTRVRHHVSGRATRSAGGGSYTAGLLPSASRPPLRCGPRSTLRQRRVTASHRFAPAITLRAALRAQLAADRVQHADVCSMPSTIRHARAGASLAARRMVAQRNGANDAPLAMLGTHVIILTFRR